MLFVKKYLKIFKTNHGWAEQDAISAEANRRCYFGRGSQNVLSRPRLTEDAITAKTSWKTACYSDKIARSLSLGQKFL